MEAAEPVFYEGRLRLGLRLRRGVGGPSRDDPRDERFVVVAGLSRQRPVELNGRPAVQQPLKLARPAFGLEQLHRRERLFRVGEIVALDADRLRQAQHVARLRRIAALQILEVGRPGEDDVIQRSRQRLRLALGDIVAAGRERARRCDQSQAKRRIFQTASSHVAMPSRSRKNAAAAAQVPLRPAEPGPLAQRRARGPARRAASLAAILNSL